LGQEVYCTEGSAGGGFRWGEKKRGGGEVGFVVGVVWYVMVSKTGGLPEGKFPVGGDNS